MKKSNKLFIPLCFIAMFILWTIAVKYIDVKPIGPDSSSVGLSSINQFVHNLTGVHLTLYNITDWSGLIPFAFCLSFAILGFIQLIKRKNIFKVDFDILLLGGFYIVTFALYLLFEYIVINYRPILINGNLEVSYPSSTTMLVLCVIPTAIMQLNYRINRFYLKRIITLILIAFILFMVIGRLISGVHWFSDIIGGFLLSTGLVSMYYVILSIQNLKKEEKNNDIDINYKFR